MLLTAQTPVRLVLSNAFLPQEYRTAAAVMTDADNGRKLRRVPIISYATHAKTNVWKKAAKVYAQSTIRSARVKT